MPGLLRAEHREQPRRAHVQGRARSDDGWVVNGQKVWTSFAQFAQRCVLLVRTGTTESAHKGITALFVDMDTPGITVRPLDAMHGTQEFSEVFFDDVVVPFERTLGEEGQGWAVAMDLLPYERSTALWHRGALLYRQFDRFLQEVATDAVTATEVGEAFEHLFAFRARSRATQHRLHDGERLGAETSIDKILIATAEQAVYDLVADGLADAVVAGDSPGDARLASGVPLLPGRVDLRRQLGDPAQHRRPATARPRERPVSGLDAEQRELFVKGLAHATASASGAALDAALADMGWADALELDPRVAVGALFSAQGRAGATSRALDVVLASALGMEPAVFVLPALGAYAPPGEGASVTGLLLGGGAAIAGVADVRVSTGDRLIPLSTESLTLRTVEGIDPAIGLVEVSGPLAGTGPSITWSDGVAAAQRALSHELIGASRAMLELAREHALDRVQFGQPIAGFQAIRHKLADVLVVIESAEASLDAAWDDGTPFAASVAKAIAGKAARLTAKHCQQVLAGIGFTAEHAFQGYLRRTRVLDQLFGDSRTLTRELGTQLLATRTVPPILPL